MPPWRDTGANACASVSESAIPPAKRLALLAQAADESGQRSRPVAPAVPVDATSTPASTADTIFAAQQKIRCDKYLRKKVARSIVRGIAPPSVAQTPLALGDDQRPRPCSQLAPSSVVPGEGSVVVLTWNVAGAEQNKGVKHVGDFRAVGDILKWFTRPTGTAGLDWETLQLACDFIALQEACKMRSRYDYFPYLELHQMSSINMIAGQDSSHRMGPAIIYNCGAWVNLCDTCHEVRVSARQGSEERSFVGSLFERASEQTRRYGIVHLLPRTTQSFSPFMPRCCPEHHTEHRRCCPEHHSDHRCGWGFQRTRGLQLPRSRTHGGGLQWHDAGKSNIDDTARRRYASW